MITFGGPMRFLPGKITVGVSAVDAIRNQDLRVSELFAGLQAHLLSPDDPRQIITTHYPTEGGYLGFQTADRRTDVWFQAGQDNAR